MILEAELLKRSIRYLLDFEEGNEIPVDGFWSLNRKLYAWQTDFDPEETLFPPPPGATVELDVFERDFWPEIRDEEVSFSNNVERAFNMCLAVVSAETWEDDKALQMLFVIDPNLILERYCMMEERDVSFHFTDEEIEVIHDLLINRLNSSGHRMATLNFLKRASEELKRAGLDFYPQFKRLEKKLQNTVVVKTAPEDRILTTAERKAPDLVIVSEEKAD